jgi:tetratricopeptide (TPR) repeat protein
MAGNTDEGGEWPAEMDVRRGSLGRGGRADLGDRQLRHSQTAAGTGGIRAANDDCGQMTGRRELCSIRATLLATVLLGAVPMFAATLRAAQPNQVATASGKCAIAINASGQAKVTVTNHCDAMVAQTVQNLLNKTNLHDRAIRQNDARLQDVEADNARLKRQIEAVSATVVTLLDGAKAPDAVQTVLDAAQLLTQGDPSAAIALLGREADAAAVASRQSARDAMTLYVRQASLQWVRDPKGALRTIDRALTLAPDDPDLLADAAELALETGGTDEAIRRIQRLRQKAEAALSISTDDQRWLRALAWSHRFLGSIYLDGDDPSGALVEYRHELSIRQRMLAVSPGDEELSRQLISNHRAIARAYRDIGDLPAALLSARQALDLALRVPASLVDTEKTQRMELVADSHSLIGDLHRERRAYPDALEAYQVGLAIEKRIAGENPGEDRQYEQFELHDRIGRVYLAQRDREAAVRSFREGLAILRVALQTDEPSSDMWRGMIVDSLLLIGRTERQRGAVEAAKAAYAEAIGIAHARLDAGVDNVENRKTLAETHSWMGSLESAAGRHAEALRHRLAARGHYKVLLVKQPDDPERRYDYAMSCLDLAMVGEVAGTKQQRIDILAEGADIVIDMHRHNGFPEDIDGVETEFRSALDELKALP